MVVKNIKLSLESSHTCTISNAVLWTAIYFLFLLFATAIDMFVWRKISGGISSWLNIITIAVFSILFFFVLTQKTGFKIQMLAHISASGIILAIGCAAFFYLLLDKTLDPIFESIFPMSEADYQDTLKTLRASPVSSFFRVCIIAPIVEELLTRGYILKGLYKSQGPLTALLVSSLLFAVLHFNMVQTASAFICAMILGILYTKTGSIFSCILAHSLYNALSLRYSHHRAPPSSSHFQV